MKKLIWLMGALVIGMAVVATYSLQQGVADLELRLEGSPQRAPLASVTIAVPESARQAPPTSSARLTSIERRLAALEAADGAPGDEPADRVAVDGLEPGASSGVLDRESLDDLALNFGLYDADGDALLDAEELAVLPGELATFDLNSDQRLGADEVDRLLELSTNARAAAARLDSTDAAFPIALDEFKGMTRRFRFLDRNADGLVSETEFISTLTEAVKQLRRFDLDHNGALTAAELWDAPTRFAASDLDGDGLVYAWEVSDLMARAKW